MQDFIYIKVNPEFRQIIGIRARCFRGKKECAMCIIKNGTFASKLAKQKLAPEL